MSKIDTIPLLGKDQVIEILNKTLEHLQMPENLQRIEEARDNVGNEMLKMMQYIFPIVMQIQLDVLKEYNYPETREALIKFARMVRNLGREDSDIVRLHRLIKAYYLPPVSVHTNSNEIEEKINSN